MSTEQDTTPRNGHTLPHAPVNQLPQVDETQLPDFLADAPTRTELDAARHVTGQAIEGQDADELRAWKSWDEIEAERQVAAEHRANLLGLQRDRNGADLKRQRKELDLDTELAEQADRDQRDAMRARSQMKRLASPISYLASQVRTRKLSLGLAAAPAAVAVLIGAANVQQTLAELQGITGGLMYWLYAGIEPLATLPLIAILALQASGQHDGQNVWQNLRGGRFRKEKFTLLAVSILLNVGPHLLLGEVKAALVWLWVPLAIVVSLSLLPALAHAFNERIVAAKTDAELGVPSGSLTGDQAKLVRQMRMVEEADLSGQLGGQRDEHGIPSSTAVRKALQTIQGRAGVPDARAVTSAIRLMKGIED